ncbi:unnamed protein product [Cuscuta campestris]|uniref:DUF632 domain-containing protein n=1 Tax=Cuscuta campestris TaxID=132261 RepID=A0A484M0T0_9ASTE|nr:unnamed protein product [Cuscuta campestris]
MGCSGSKPAVDTELVIRCRERRDFIKAAAGYRYDLAAAHVSYFRSLKEVGDALRRFVDEELAAAASSSSSCPSSLSSPSWVVHSDGAAAKELSCSSSPNHRDFNDFNGCGKDSHLHLSSDAFDEEHLNSNHFCETSGRGLGGDEDEGHSWPASPFLHPDLPMGTQGPYVVMNQEAPPQMGFWDPFYTFHAPSTSQFRAYNGGNSDTHAYYMKRHTPEMRTVIHQAGAASTAYSNEYWSSHYQNGEDFFGYPPVGPSEGEKNRNQAKKPSPPEDVPPPPSSTTSVWDFLNPFDGIDQGISSYMGYGSHAYGSANCSPDSAEVRRREGIPDLEDETEIEMHVDEPMVKKMSNDFKKKRAGEGTSGTRGKTQQRRSAGVEQSMKRMSRRKPTVSSKYAEEYLAKKPMPTKSGKGSPVSRGSPAQDSSGSSPKPHSSGNEECSICDVTGSTDVSEEKASSDTIVSKSPGDGNVKTKGVTFEVDREFVSSKLSNLDNTASRGTRDLREVVAEIRDGFEIASSCGRDIDVMLEVGKLPYHPTFIRVLMSRILHSLAPFFSTLHATSTPAVQINSKLEKSYIRDDVPEANLKQCYLSSTLAQLYEWEKKLYKEVKTEEQLRLVYERQCRKLKALDLRGIESSKIDAVQASIRKSRTKLKVSIKAIDFISSRIHNLRDEVLLPQVAELVNGLTRMWKSMLSCHQKQFQAIKESKVRALKAKTGFDSDSALEATLELELQLLAWCNRFSNWICTQKSYVESLNGWLLRCLLYEPEETPDGPVPFSPGRLQAPPIFIICNDWNLAMETISETRVAMAMNSFASSLRKLCERHDDEQHQRLRSEYLLKDYKKILKMRKMENERMRHEREDKNEDSMVQSESAGSQLDNPEADHDLEMVRKKLVEEKSKHKNSLKLVHDAASSSIQGGLLPIFKALESFTSEAVKAHEQVRGEKYKLDRYVTIPCYRGL